MLRDARGGGWVYARKRYEALREGAGGVRHRYVTPFFFS